MFVGLFLFKMLLRSLKIFKKTMQIKNVLIIPVVLILILGNSAGMQDLRNKGGVNVLSSLEVITCNIGDLGGYQRLEREEIVDFFKLCGVPDVLLLQEVGNQEEAEYFSDKLGLKYFVFSNDFQRTHGMAILSGLPLLNPDKLYFKTSKYGYGAVAADLVVGEKKIQVVNVHMDRIDQITMKDKKIEVALKDLGKKCISLKVLGSYPVDTAV